MNTSTSWKQWHETRIAEDVLWAIEHYKGGSEDSLVEDILRSKAVKDVFKAIERYEVALNALVSMVEDLLDVSSSELWNFKSWNREKFNDVDRTFDAWKYTNEDLL